MSGFTAAVFASGGGSNFQALLDHDARLWRVGLLVLNREAGARARADAASVPVALIPTKDRAEDDVGEEMLATLDMHEVDIVLLAGYLRKLPPAVVAHFRGRVLNIHPALLPAFGGKGMYGRRVHEAVLEAGELRSGATVHLVTDEYDEGGIVGQWSVEVLPGDTAESLADRVLRVEHRLYPLAVDHLCAALADGRALERMSDVALDVPRLENDYTPKQVDEVAE